MNVCGPCVIQARTPIPSAFNVFHPPKIWMFVVLVWPWQCHAMRLCLENLEPWPRCPLPVNNVDIGITRLALHLAALPRQIIGWAIWIWPIWITQPGVSLCPLILLLRATITLAISSSSTQLLYLHTVCLILGSVLASQQTPGSVLPTSEESIKDVQSAAASGFEFLERPRDCCWLPGSSLLWSRLCQGRWDC